MSNRRIFSVEFYERRLHEYSFEHSCSKGSKCLVHCSRNPKLKRKKSLRDHRGK